MELSKKEYSQYVKEMSPNSPFWKDLFNAFWVGGLICVVGQMILNGFTAMGLDETDAGTATSVSMVFLGALLTGLSVYDDIAKIGGAGTLVPITGFSNAVVSPAIEFKSEGLVTGLAAKIFIIAGPVLVYGITASAVYGIIYWIWTML
ncbi:MAG: stage V sporulation protein AC [Candidatus Avoscillospira sp.]